MLNLDPEISFKTSRSSGKGGQNVNKVSTKVELDFDVAESAILTAGQKELIFTKLRHRITKTGILQMVAQSERSQSANKEIAIQKFYAAIWFALTPAKKRFKTKPTRSSKEKRLDSKKKISEKKGLRRKNYFD